MKKNSVLLLLLIAFASAATAQDLVISHPSPGTFPIARQTTGATPIYVDPAEDWLVKKAAAWLQDDIEKVTGIRPVMIDKLDTRTPIPNLIMIGSLNSSSVIRDIIHRKHLSAATLTGKWEAFGWQTTLQPISGIGRALLITGSDRRGTAFGILELSRQMGVSPWYWWADVPVKKKKEVFIHGRPFLSGSPSVKYRGFFINDEAPALTGWAREKFGGLNHHFYEKVFELLLRLKANYLWPAMWGNAFNDDDPLNPMLAEQYGIVMGTSHHEPMLRAQQEWKRYGHGAWNYETNAATLDSFWRTGIHNMDHHESIITVGMRGDGDMPMQEGSNIALLEKIVADQRKIIGEVTGKDPATVPQSWALYKEVQDYYDKGMRVPDDITLLLCDDNWGNVRRLPRLQAPPRSGGYGLYYHFDYVGGPRNYKWINTNPIPRIWEQLHLTKEYGADRIWIVNVGDIKPMELPIGFFFDYAWDVTRWPAGRLPAYTRDWAAAQFGPEHAGAIATILDSYTRFNGRRKPELLSPGTYSLLHYNEAERVTADYDRLADQARALDRQLPPEVHDAFYQLVLYPFEASANLYELYLAAAKNKLYASQGRAATNEMAQQVKERFEKDSILSRYYNKEMAAGKWDHMMDQTHIGYTGWQQPDNNHPPETQLIDLATATGPSWGVAIEGSALWWPEEKGPATLPAFDRFGQKDSYIEIFNRRRSSFSYTVSIDVPWLKADSTSGIIDRQTRIHLRVDWQKVPAGTQHAVLSITGQDGNRISVMATAHSPSSRQQEKMQGFIGANGYISMEAEHYSRKVETAPIKWQVIPGLGRTSSGMEAFPVTAAPRPQAIERSRLEYDLYLPDSGSVKVMTYCSPTLDFSGTGHLRYGISVDRQPPRIIDLAADTSLRTWASSVADNIRIMSSQHRIATPGKHILKFWRIDPGVVLQKIVIDTGGLQPGYLGPPESRRRTTPAAHP